MEMSEKEAFRLGFLTRCAEEGLTGPALQERMKIAAEKKAIAEYLIPGALALGGLGLARGIAGPELTGTMIGLPAAAGLAGGAALGYGAAKVTEPDISADDIKAQELADTYRVYAAKARANRKAQKYRTHRAI
jgi:hypothetical protein